MADFLTVLLVVFLINIVPAFMPPTWLVLALARIDNPGLDPLALVIGGAFASTAGRAVLSFYSSFFRRFFSSGLSEHAEQLRRFFERHEKGLFLGTFVFSLGPFPSNMIFIADGLTKVDPRPVFAGFFLGRLVSYFLFVELSLRFFHLFGASVFGIPIGFAADMIGILGALSVIFVDWGKISGSILKRRK